MPSTTLKLQLYGAKELRRWWWGLLGLLLSYPFSDLVLMVTEQEGYPQSVVQQGICHTLQDNKVTVTPHGNDTTW